MANLKNVIYLSNEDYETLVSTGTVTIDGETLTYDENNVYVTPDKLASTTEDGLMSAADKSKLDTITGVTTSVASGSSDLVTSGAVYTAINNLPAPMIYKGTLGTGGTITALPTASSSNEGFTYKVITTGTYASQSAKVGDVFISNGSAWTLVPAGDDVEDTWRQINVNGTQFKGTGISTGAINFKNGSNVTITGSGNDITISASQPTVNNGTLTIQKNGTNVQTFTANQSSNVTANITVPTKTSELTNDSKFLTSESDTLSTVLTRGNSANKDIDLNYHDFFNAGVQKTAYNYSTSQDPNTQYWWYQIVPPGGSQSDRYLICVEGDENYPRGRGTYILDLSKYSTDTYSVSLNCIGSTNYNDTLHLLNVAMDASGNVYVQANAAWSSYLRFIRHNSNTTTQSYTQVGKAAFGTVSGFTSLKMIQDTGCIRVTGGALDTDTTRTGHTQVYSDSFIENGTVLSNKYLGKTAKAADADKLDGNDSSYYLNYNNLTNKPTIPTESTVSGWGFTKNTGTVTSVDSISPSSGNVALSAVRYAAQTLTDAQKTQARTNIGAGTSSFTGYTSSNKLHTDYINNAAGWTSNKGTVTSVSAGAGLTTTSGSSTDGGTITSSGTLYLTKTGVAAGTYTKVTTDTYGRITNGTNLAASDIPNLNASKITSGTFADSRIASANTWNNKISTLETKIALLESIIFESGKTVTLAVNAATNEAYNQSGYYDVTFTYKDGKTSSQRINVPTYATSTNKVTKNNVTKFKVVPHLTDFYGGPSSSDMTGRVLYNGDLLDVPYTILGAYTETREFTLVEDVSIEITWEI